MPLDSSLLPQEGQLDTPPPEDVLSPEDLVSAYNSVFSVRGGAVVAKRGPQVDYAEDLLRRMPELGAAPFQPLELSQIRSLPKNQLMRLLFKAVAGHFIAGPSSLRGDTCRLQADPKTGTLELVREGCGKESALVVIALVLLCVLFVMLYRKERDRQADLERAKSDKT